ncbi:MAG: ribbon-helix-helix domain-containing protein [Thermoplasmatota archaeon]
MEKADKVTIRLTAEQAEAIDFLVESGRFKNRSKAIRAAIDELISIPEEEEQSGPVRVEARLPDTMVAEIDTLVDLEYFQSREQGLWELVRNGLLQINVDSLRERSKDRTANVADRNAKNVIDDIYSEFVSQ